MKVLLSLLILSSFFLLLPSCGDDQDVTVRLTSRERTKIDTLYAERSKILRPQWDSICELRHDSTLAFAVDSIVKTRLVEEVKLRERILQAAREDSLK